MTTDTVRAKSPIGRLADDGQLGIMTFESTHLFVVVFCLQLVLLASIPQSSANTAWKGNMQKHRFGMSFDMETVGHSSCCSRKPSKVGERAREVVAGVCKVLPGTSTAGFSGTLTGPLVLTPVYQERTEAR